MTKFIKYSIAILFVFTYLGVNAQEIEIFQIIEQMPRFPGCEDQENKREKDDCAALKWFDLDEKIFKINPTEFKNKILSLNPKQVVLHQQPCET